SVDVQPGERTVLGFRLLLESPSLAGRDKGETATLTLPIPKVAGVSRVGGTFAVIGSPGVAVRDVKTGSLTIQTEGALDENIEHSPFFVAEYKFLSLPETPTAGVRRIQPRFDADIDTLVDFRLEAIHIERTVTLHEREGELFELSATVPDGEEVLSVLREDGT